DISSTNDALEEITLTNGTVKGDFVLANTDFELDSNGAVQDDDNAFNNVDQANFVKAGLTSITATDFDGDIVLGRDSDIVDLGTLSAAVNGDVTYNATLNDKASYTATTGNGADTLDITLIDSITEGNRETDTAVTISTGAANDNITVDEGDNSAENTTATITAGAGDDVIRGNDVSVNVTAGTGNDVIYAENTGEKALLTLDTSGLYQNPTPATNAINTTHPTGAELVLLAGKQVQVTIATDGNSANLVSNGYQSSVVTIEASSGTLTTIDDLNNAVLEAINDDEVLNKIAVASIDENDDVVVTYLVDGVQAANAVSLSIANPASVTGVSTALLNDYRDFINDSTYSSAELVTNVNKDASGVSASADSFVGSTIKVDSAGNQGTEIVVTIDGEEVSLTLDADTDTGNPTVKTTALKIATALVEAGYAAASDGTDTVYLVTQDENLTVTGVDTDIKDDVTLAASSGLLLGEDSSILGGIKDPGSREVTTVSLGSLAAGETYIFDGLTISAGATTGVTAAELAAYINANFSGNTNLSTSGSLATTTVTSVVGTTVTYTATTVGDATNLSVSGTSTTSSVASTIDGEPLEPLDGNVNTVNGNAGDDVIVLSSDDTANALPNPPLVPVVPVDYDTVVWTGYSQGSDTIVHFESGIDKLDFTSYLTGTVDSATPGASSNSTESEVVLPNTAVTTEVFTANSINLLDFSDLDGMATDVTFENATAAQIQAALNADDDMSVVRTDGLYQTRATSVLIIEDGVNATGGVTGDIQNDGTYKAYEVTYANTDVSATSGGTAGTYTVTLIGEFDLGDDTLSVAISPGDFIL
ncbi:beta strand repeat-containing protein, partial [Marinomonas sp. 2405UD68-3]|uniref:beta strand repeat-containing protein n=1 Tax=Marinomonas sp. 2405UD68-3 TaxID=3391835 RepID=UPI0039C9655E